MPLLSVNFTEIPKTPFFSCSEFQKVFAKTPSSGSQPFVVSRKAASMSVTAASSRCLFDHLVARKNNGCSTTPKTSHLVANYDVFFLMICRFFFESLLCEADPAQSRMKNKLRTRMGTMRKFNQKNKQKTGR